jgi:hypothetical protein
MADTKSLTFKKELIQYVFIDVVDFTHADRTVEDMVEIIRILNELVLQVLDECGVHQQDLILIPTGDGMCICLRNQLSEDRHLKIALALREHVLSNNLYNYGTGCEFELHIGVHEGKDIIILDINERENVIGAGINKAARLMAKCPPGDIFISSTVHEGVHRYAQYKGTCTRSSFEDKSGEVIEYYVMQKQANKFVKGLVRLFETTNYTIGPLLTPKDIEVLRAGAMIYHKVYGIGSLERIDARPPNARGRRAVIKFMTKTHTVTLTNTKGNYHSCKPKP